MAGQYGSKNGVEVERKTNNFDFLRLMAAIIVLIAHSFSITGRKQQEPFYALSGGEMYLGTIGLIIFFIISGYLIAKSWDRHKDAIIYLWGRFLRIVPGLACVVLLTLFIIGPLVTTYTTREYFSNSTTLKYLGTITVFYNPNNLPGVFINNPDPSGPNGALWTLPIEFSLYILIMLAAFIGLFYKRFVLLCTTVIAIFLYLYNSYAVGTPLSIVNKILSIFGIPSFVYPFTSQGLISLLMILFMIGTMYYLYRERIQYKPSYILLAILLWFPTIFIGGWVLQLATFLFVPYAILGLAHIKLPYTTKVTKYGDFSYGMYIYGAPVQQTIVYFFGAISVPFMIILSVLSVAPFAVLSWHFIESRALRLKSVNVSGIVDKSYRSVLINVSAAWHMVIK